MSPLSKVRDEAWRQGVAEGLSTVPGCFEVPSEGGDFEGDGVAMTQSQSRTRCSCTDDGRK